MKYRLEELIDLPKLQKLLDSLYSISDIPTAIIDVHSNVLTASGWQDICTRFHRVHPDTSQNCLKSDAYIVNKLSNRPNNVIYKCPNGLIDTATPIIVDNEHIGNTFTGQLFLEKPDIEFFRKQALKYGFDEEAYIEALRRVPVISQETLERNLFFLTQFTELLAEQGLKQLRQLEVKEALREREEFLNNMFESIRDGINILDRDLNIIQTNKAFESLYPHKMPVVGKKCYEVSYNTKEPCEICPCIRTLESGNSHMEIISHKGSEGKESWREIYTFPLMGKKSDEIIGVIENIRDITERKKLEEELLKSQKLESVGILARGIAHDFNNLLQGIFLNVHLAKISVEPGSKAHSAIDKTEKNITRARNLTQQLLTFSKGSVPVKKTFPLSPFIEDSVNFALSGSTVISEIALPEDLLPVEADEGQLYQVIQNLILNAVQAMPDGGTIRVTAENSVIDKESDKLLTIGEYVVLYIIDTGKGIPDEHMSKIFDPFFTTKTSGQGLGLASAYSIIKKHRGVIKVDSKCGVGTTFSIYLPAARRKIPVKGIPAEDLIAGAGKILIMDDDEVIRSAITKGLGELGYEVCAINNGEEAIHQFIKARVAESPFDVVILDLTVPGGMGGKETINRIREIDHNVKAIVSSGYANDQVLADYNDFGFTAALPKPYKMDELSKIVHEVISLPK